MLNHDDVVGQIQGWIARGTLLKCWCRQCSQVWSHDRALALTVGPCMHAGEFELGTCMLCFDEVPKAQLLRVCGRKRCDAVACTACLDAW